VSYDDYLAFATNASPSGKMVGGVPMSVLYDYVAGTDPTDTNDVFKAEVTIGADGIPSVTWTPNRPELRTARVYKLKGATSLSGPWAETDATNPSAEFRQTNNFFKVTVELAP
jgi:hypothetical protein